MKNMPSTIPLAEIIRREANKLQGMLELAAWLEEVGSLDNAISDRKKVYNQASEQAVVAMAQVKSLNDSMAEMQRKIVSEHGRLQEMVAVAHKEAEAIRSQAKYDASTLLNDAKAEIAEIKQESGRMAEAVVALATQKKKDLLAEIKALEAQKPALQEELGLLEDKLSKAKESAKRMMEA